MDIVLFEIVRASRLMKVRSMKYYYLRISKLYNNFIKLFEQKINGEEFKGIDYFLAGRNLFHKIIHFSG